MYHIAICDDESVFIHQVSALLQQYAKMKNLIFQLHSFSDPRTLQDEILDGSVHDIYLLDVEMPSIDGFSLAKQIKNAQPHAPILFLTSHIEMSREGYKVDALRYVSKLSLEDELNEALDAALAEADQAEKHYLTITHYHDIVRIPYDEILYVQKLMRYLEIHTSRQEIIKAGRGIKEIFEKIGDERFVFVSRNCFVNLDHVQQLSESFVKMDTDESLPISRRMLPGVKSTILQVWGEKP
ncbi:LytR/AlgR family response regulator transcription factor [Acutalibacter muris]|jgi:DNA-binding LytR/AlgR family response regulator|uniref:LytR/AlgR family response regulator transcription factor n=1 Tax=Acutalibacter muris TaxID=1796620 RepID=UPI0026F3A5C0|nr:LytTR family DNA-binding domain-containing protein [Acutalibacter muris]